MYIYDLYLDKPQKNLDFIRSNKLNNTKQNLFKALFVAVSYTERIEFSDARLNYKIFLYLLSISATFACLMICVTDMKKEV